MIYLTTVVLIVAFLIFIDRERQRQNTLIASIAASGSPDLCEMIAIVDRLCQRIQAPSVAVAEHNQATVGEFAPPAVSMFSDDEHHESKEELAERLAAAEAQRIGMEAVHVGA